ncbi:hypothetical protein ENSA5_01590 [Enhygromyxa salina]|uniref:Uncharacterized protein n=1 Tax=Enhygromyxa salina TaxID=215803 RepID=A0A2S9YL64_9BACT|nr:hypothetical protein [Enhygromyxa salina]PRQ05839.1 hypothetical protein ENSA5_01590 [Enhygromyxa salina]
MKNSTRRNLLAKLGVGAAAAAALAVSGTSSTANAGAVPINPKRVVEMQVEGTKLQVAVRIDPKQGGFVMQASPLEGEPKLGLTKTGHTLNLGVSVKNNGVSIAGLDAVLNRAASANSGRCWFDDVDVAVKM